MRAIAALTISGLILAAVCGMVAILGRSLDWSPYALTLLGALAGWLFAFGTLMLLWVDEA